MEIVHFLRRCRLKWLNYKSGIKYNSVINLRSLIRQHDNLKSIIIEKEVLILELTGNVKFEWENYNTSYFNLVISEKYEAFERHIIKNILTADDVVFDIGANIGYFSIFMKSYCPLISLHSFEPIKATYSTLLRNLGYNLLSDVKTYNFGFSNENSEVTFHIPEQLGGAWASMGTGVSSVYNYKLNPEIATVCRLDDFVAKSQIPKIDFIKCDVEGAEKLVIEGALETLKRDKPTLMLEIGNMWSASFGYDRETLINLMIVVLDYRCFGVLVDHVVELNSANEVNQYSEEIMYNFFFVHPSKPIIINKLERLIK